MAAEHRRERREHRRQQGDQPVLTDVVAHDLLQRSQAVRRQRRDRRRPRRQESRAAARPTSPRLGRRRTRPRTRRREPAAAYRPARRCHRFTVAILRVAGDADDLDGVGPVAHVHLHSLADHIRAEIEAVQERLVDDGDFAARRDVGSRELPAGDQRHGQGLEETRADPRMPLRRGWCCRQEDPRRRPCR